MHPCQLLRTVPAASACSLASCFTSGVHDVWSSCAFSSNRQHQSWRCCSNVSSDAAVSQVAAAVPEQEAAAAQEWTVLNFYHLVDISNPEEVCLVGQPVTLHSSRHCCYCQAALLAV